MIRQALDNSWTLVALDGVPDAWRGRDIPAVVPGCVHTDLLAAGLIPDPYVERNELELQWIGAADWRYSCTFEVAAELLAEEHVELVCEGLDTVARLKLNGTLIGEAENMHLAYRFPVKPHLRVGENQLTITFTSAVRYAVALQERLGALPHVNLQDLPFNFIRKMACNFGWDWGPTLVTAGIWQPIYLQAWSQARLASVRPLIKRADAERAEVEVQAAIEGMGQGLKLAGTLEDPDGHTVAQSSGEGVLTLAALQPQLWWPRGHGEQPLYTLTIALNDAHGTPLDTWTSRIGLRTVKLQTEADDHGSAFTLVINGKPIFCKGANWIPDDCFPHRVTEARYRSRLKQAVGANMNMLRVWGGGIYETETFYRLCDEFGLMVWQDFLFACALYPEEPPFDRLVEAEARYQITRLAKHPSLVLWNGNNENIWGYFDWSKGGRSWRETGSQRSWGLGFYLELLPNLVAELDPSRPYWPGSPYSGTMDIHPNHDRFGCKHIWDVWNERDYTAYREYKPRFVTEFGFQAPPSFATLRRAIGEQLEPDSAAMLHHQKAVRGNDKLMARLTEHFHKPKDFDTWHYLTQLNQARAVQLGVEWFRSRQPDCMGALYWQLNDCWPVISWAAVDGDGRPKPLWYATRRFFADRLLTIQPQGEALALYAINDSDAKWLGQVTLRRLTFAGREVAAQELELALAPRTTALLGVIAPSIAVPDDPTAELLVAATADARAYWFFERDKVLAYPPPAFDAALEREGETHRLTITAKTLLRDLCIYADRLEPNATVSDQLLTLLPGESATVVINSAKELDLETLTSHPVLRCVNTVLNS